MSVMSEFVWKKQETIAEVSSMPENVRKVLVIYTGGTIGMKVTAECGRYYERDRSRFCEIITMAGLVPRSKGASGDEARSEVALIIVSRRV